MSSFTSNLKQTRTAEPYFNIYDVCKIMANAGGVPLLATSLTETHPSRHLNRQFEPMTQCQVQLEKNPTGCTSGPTGPYVNTLRVEV